MKRLTLARHAKSSWKDGGLRDVERPLNGRGRRDAPMMGQRLAGRSVLPDLIVSSPANRARTTAELIAPEIGYPLDRIVLDERIYGADTDGLMEVVWALDDRFEHVMLFGHNPTITEFVNMIGSRRVDNVPTCGIAELAFDAEHWADCRRATLEHFDYPKRLT